MGKWDFKWDKLKTDLEDESKNKKKGFQKDERFWKPTVDEKGNATAVIRFLPDKTGNPWIKYFTHNFNYMDNGVKKYWIRNCINTFGYDKECPICKKNQEYWNSSFKTDKDIASARKRKLVYVANILVIKNPANPDDEGKVFLYNFGEKIFGKINDKMFPSDKIKELGEYDEYIPFDLQEGANFKFIQVKQGEYPNYDNSEFFKQSAVGNEKKIDAVMESTYDLSEFIAADKFPTNEEVLTKLGKILCVVEEADKKDTNINTPDPDDDIPFFDDIQDEPAPSEISSSDSDDDAYFKNL